MNHSRMPVDEQQALHGFAKLYRTKWRSALRDCWNTGSYPEQIVAAGQIDALQRIKATRGPGFLSSRECKGIVKFGPTVVLLLDYAVDALLQIVEAELADDPEPDDLKSWHRAIALAKAAQAQVPR